MRGGILADDMGLGKTLSILSLILTNFHDKRPLARPQHGFKRHFDKNVTRYLPRTPADKQVGTGQPFCPLLTDLDVPNQAKLV